MMQRERTKERKQDPTTYIHTYISSKVSVRPSKVHKWAVHSMNCKWWMLLFAFQGRKCSYLEKHNFNNFSSSASFIIGNLVHKQLLSAQISLSLSQKNPKPIKVRVLGLWVWILTPLHATLLLSLELSRWWVGVHQLGLRLFGGMVSKRSIIEPFFQWILNKN
jgi:hypothetical protein